MSFLDINISAPKPKIYLSVTPGVGIELLQMDYNSNTVANYAMRELQYNESKREIADYNDFKNAVSSMYEELGINPKCQVVLNIPVVSFGIMQLGLLLPNDAITGAIQSNVEQSYLFRQSEPVISWTDIASEVPGEQDVRPVAYSAIQREMIEKIADKLSELGSKLVGIEDSLCSTFRALEYMGVTANQMQPSVPWDLMIINSYGYTWVTMSGKNIIDYDEEIIPIITLEGEEIYDSILESVQLRLSEKMINYLYIVSDTNMVSAAELVAKLDIIGSIDYLENNAFKTKDSLIPVSLNVITNYEYPAKISLQAIGCALSEISNFPLKFNYLRSAGMSVEDPSCTIPIGEHEYTITKSQAQKLSIIIAGILLIIFASLAYGLVPALKKSFDSKVQAISTKLDDANAELKELKGNGDISNFDLKREVEIGVKSNRAKLMNFVAPGENIPDDVWLTYFMTQGNGLVDIKGEASDVGSVYVFFKSMRDSLNSTGSKLKLQNLEMISKSVDAAVSGAGAYRFEITNMSSDELNRLNNQTNDNDNNDNSSNDSQTSQQKSETVPEGDLLGDQPIE